MKCRLIEKHSPICMHLSPYLNHISIHLLPMFMVYSHPGSVMGDRSPGLLLMASMARVCTVRQATSTNSSTLDSNQARGSTTTQTIKALGLLGITITQ